MNAQPFGGYDGAGRSQLLTGRSILLVEDESIVAFLIEDMLRELGASGVSHAPNVAKALALLEDTVPHIAVLDINLGYELVYPVAAHLRARSIPFIFASGYGKSGVAPEWSAHTVLQKPFDAQMLGEALHRELGRAT
jgi:CheY-like chemotaxis protein